MLASALALKYFSCINHCRRLVEEVLGGCRHSLVEQLVPVLSGIILQKHIMHFMSLFPMHILELNPYPIMQRGGRFTVMMGLSSCVPDTSAASSRTGLCRRNFNVLANGMSGKSLVRED